MPDMKFRTWCLETIPIRTYYTSSHSLSKSNLLPEAHIMIFPGVDMFIPWVGMELA